MTGHVTATAYDTPTIRALTVEDWLVRMILRQNAIEKAIAANRERRILEGECCCELNRHVAMKVLR